MSESPKDKFEELFRMQQSLNERIGVRTTGMSEEEQTKWLLNYARAMTQEMGWWPITFPGFDDPPYGEDWHIEGVSVSSDLSADFTQP